MASLTRKENSSTASLTDAKQSHIDNAMFKWTFPLELQSVKSIQFGQSCRPIIFAD